MRWNWRLAATIFLRVLLVAAAVIVAALIAWLTRLNAHPDELIHLDAFEYFRAHWLRPAPGAPGIMYSVYGWSRIFNGEIVYLLYGKIGVCVLHFWPHVGAIYIYRFCNVGLLLITLAILVFSRCRLFAPWLLAIVLVSIPQVIYVYSYANSDAFGISASILLFWQTARMLDRPARQWGRRSIAIFLLLFLCTLLAKVAFEIGILLPLALIAVHLFRDRIPVKFILLRLVIPLLAVYVLAAWWNPQLSPWRGQWSQRMTAMRQEKAIAGRKPIDDAPAPGIYLAKQHWTLGRMLRLNHHDWLRFTCQSFYGQFGYMDVVLASWIYMTAACTSIALLLLTLCAFAVYAAEMNRELLLCMVYAPLLIAMNLFGSMFHSLYIDYQPQGRYLFASLLGVFFLCLGTWTLESRWWQIVRGAILMMLMSLSFYALIEYACLNPALR